MLLQSFLQMKFLSFQMRTEDAPVVRSLYQIANIHPISSFYDFPFSVSLLTQIKWCQVKIENCNGPCVCVFLCFCVCLCSYRLGRRMIPSLVQMWPHFDCSVVRFSFSLFLIVSRLIEENVFETESVKTTYYYEYYYYIFYYYISLAFLC